MFFAAGDELEELCRHLAADPVDVATFVVADSSASCAVDVSVLDADVRHTAKRFGLPDPLADVPPTGYVVVDRAGRIRYRTLDPSVGTPLDEVATMLRGVS